MKHKMLKKLSIISIIAGAWVFLVYANLSGGNAAVPPLKEGTYLSGQTLSVWPSWSLLGNYLGVSLPNDPINQLAPAGTCITTTNRFCTQDSQCPNGETCVLHDPETGWSVANRRFTFACAKESYAYRYIVSSTPDVYTVRARLEDPGITPANFNSFVAGFIDPKIVKIDESSGVCNFDQEISSMQAGVCGDGKLNLDKGEQCDPPGRVEYANTCVGPTRNLTVCGSNCQWISSTTPCGSLGKCGNGALEAGEVCDEGALNGRYNHCNMSCTGVSALGKCGDGVLQSAYEVCDPGTPGQEKYALNRTDSCNWDCQGFGPYCGDKIIQSAFGEECDGSQACSVDGKPGMKICDSGCKKSPAATSTDNWACTISAATTTYSAPGTCGDGAVDNGEVCDQGLSENGRACVPTYGAPCSYCSADCQNTIDVQPLQYCGNGIIEGPEKCEMSGINIFSAAAAAGRTLSQKDETRNGYLELACADETPLPPRAIKKGTKSCGDCATGVVRNCVQCGVDPSGVTVEGTVLNILDNSLMASQQNRKPDPLFAKEIIKSSLVLAVSNKPFTACPFNSLPGACSPWVGNFAPVAAVATKTPTSTEFSSYTLINPYVAGNSPAKLNSHPLCSAGDDFSAKYHMYVNNDLKRPLNFPVVGEPTSGQYDLVLSPVVSSTLRAKDLRVVVSWVGGGDFYSGVFNPFAATTTIEGPSYTLKICAPTCFTVYGYANGTDYYSAPASYKKTGVWYHGFDATPGQTNAEAFTIDTAAMSGNTYAFYVRAPSYPIRTFKNTARLKVDVYLPENDNSQYHFGTPVKTYYFLAASPSDNQSARYWQVFNINAPSSNLSVSDIIDINAIVTGPAYFQYTNPLIAKPPCTDEDWVITSPPQVCPPSEVLTVTWAKKSTSNCTGGVEHQPTEEISCNYVGEMAPPLPPSSPPPPPPPAPPSPPQFF